MKPSIHAAATVSAIAVAAVALSGQQPSIDLPEIAEAFRFKSGVELVNVNATVSDSNGRFVSGLRQEDFLVYEDDELQTITQFSAERVPVSLGLVLDTSGSMAGDKISAARAALNRFLVNLFDRDDEMFLYQFGNSPVLVQDWTRDKRRLAAAIAWATPNGGTAMYDAVAEAVSLAAVGMNRKKAVVVISDGNDTSSRTDIRELKQRIRESEVLVYAVGIDRNGRPTRSQPTTRMPRPRTPTPFPFPFPPRRAPTFPGQPRPQIFGGRPSVGDDRVNVAALRDMTDDSGGRTEIIQDPGDLDSATAGISDELSKQYYLGYSSTLKKDGRWHAIRLEMRNNNYRVRARSGYLAN